MGSPFDDAFIELLDVNDECHAAHENGRVVPNPQFVLIGGKRKRAIIEDITTEEILLLGGTGDIGGFRAKVRSAEFTKEPAKGTSIQKLGKGPVMEVLSVISRNGCEYEITAGDLVARESDNG